MRARARQLRRGAALLAMVALVGATGSGAASSSVVVTMDVASATNLDRSACLDDDPGVTAFGVVQPGASAVTGVDCTIQFGSSNDTAQLRLGQVDGRGRAMWKPTDGSPDLDWDGDASMPGFPGNGTVTTSFTAGADEAIESVLQPDGKLLVVGSDGDDFVIARYTTTGALDTTFNGTGRQTVDIFGIDTARDVAVQDDGKVVVVGSAREGSVDPIAAIVRLNADGSLDTNSDADPATHWNTTGVLQLNIEPGVAGGERLDAVAIDGSGRVVAGGDAAGVSWNDTSIARLDATGTLDPTFDGDITATCYPCDGVVRYDLNANQDGIDDLTLQADGKIVAVGAQCCSGSHDGMVARFLTDGSFDPGFGASGRLAINWSANANFATALKIDATGRILVAGYDGGGGGRMAIARITSTGSHDNSFSDDGRDMFDIGAGDDGAADVAVLPDGSYLLAGASGVGDQDATLVRVRSTGGLEPSFGSAGVLVDAQHASNDDWLSSLEQTADGSVVAVGAGNDDFLLLGLAGATVPDYDDVGGDDWATPGASLFGACLHAVGGGTTQPQWTDSGACAIGDGSDWNAVPAASEKVAFTTAATTTATAGLRFGVRTSTAQAPGRYVAPISIEVLAPDA